MLGVHGRGESSLHRRGTCGCRSPTESDLAVGRIMLTNSSPLSTKAPKKKAYTKKIIRGLFFLIQDCYTAYIAKANGIKYYRICGALFGGYDGASVRSIT